MESFAARLHIEWLRSLTLADEMGFEFSGPGARERHWNAYRATKIDALSARVAELEAENARLREALENIVANARLQADARMDGTTDIWAVPLDDIVAARAALVQP